MPQPRALFAAALAVSAFAAMAPATQADGITVFAASSLKTALDPIAADWQAATGNSVAISYGASSALAKQIIEGAPADVFLSAAVNWKGGGGIRFYRLAPSLLQKDKFDNWVISQEFNPEMLAEACCKLEGFEYAPSDSIYWQHGRSTETDFIYVTTQHFTASQLQQLNDEVGTDRTLLVLCKSFNGKPDRWPRLTVKKIPKAVLTRCEWGHDDYSLKIENLPQAPKKMAQQLLFDALEDE